MHTRLVFASKRLTCIQYQSPAINITPLKSAFPFFKNSKVILSTWQSINFSLFKPPLLKKVFVSFAFWNVTREKEQLSKAQSSSIPSKTISLRADPINEVLFSTVPLVTLFSNEHDFNEAPLKSTPEKSQPSIWHPENTASFNEQSLKRLWVTSDRWIWLPLMFDPRKSQRSI